MGALQMRPYQQAAREAIHAEWNDGRRRTLLVLPTGTGKTIVFAAVTEDQVRSGSRVLVLAHRGELLEQAADKIKRSTGLASAVEKAEQTCLDSWCRVVVGSVQSLQRPARLEQFPADYFGTIIIDEAHHAITDGYQRVLEHFPEANVLGVTATPDRGDMAVLSPDAKICLDYDPAECILPITIRHGRIVDVAFASEVTVGGNAKIPAVVGVLSKQADDNILYGTIYVPTGTTVNKTVYPMLNLGNTAMPYEPYQGSVTQLPIPRPLHEVGDVRDVCRTRVKSVYDKRIVLDGSEANLGYNEEYSTLLITGVLTAGSITETNVYGVCISSHFSSIPAGGHSTGKTDIIWSQPRLKQLVIHSPKFSSLETAKAYLSAQKAAGTPVTVYYQSTSYNGTNGLDVCLTEYQNGSIELDGTESQFTYAATETKGLVVGLADDLEIGFLMLCSHGVYSSTGTESIRVWRLSSGKVGIYLPESLATPYGYDGTVTTVKSAAAGYFAAQKEAGTPVQIAYQLATPEVYATDPVDFDNTAGPLTVLTGGELEAAFKSADKVVESRIDFVEDTLNEQGQAIAEKAPISHSSDKSTYGLGSGSQFGHVKLSDATASGSNAGQGIAATPSAVNQVHAKANAAQSTANAAMPKAGGTFTGTVAAKTENIAGAYIRNISVQNSASQLQYTNFIIMVRK